MILTQNLRKTAIFFALLVSISAAVGQEAGFTAPEPEDLIIYQVFIDRFENGRTSNDNANPRGQFNPTSPTGFHGGDIEGIRQRLPYIRGLGANAIWMTPHVENVRDYHGYGAYNWYNVDPNFGTMAELRQMIDEANDHGIAIYFDMVAGHMGNIIRSNQAGWPQYKAPPETYQLVWSSSLRYPAPFNSLEYFHAHGHIQNFVAPEQELGELSGLDDLKTETQYVRDQMLAVWTYWLTETNVSGFRIDTVKHVERGFWEYFLPRLSDVAQSLGRTNYFTFGEIYGADDAFMRPYIGTLTGAPYKLDAAVDFQFYYASNGVFARADRPPSDIVGRLQGRASQLGVHHLKMPNFIDNHDVPRFLNVAAGNPGSGAAEQRRRLELGLAFLYTAPGPPILYYGTEQGFNGGQDPFNRENMFDGRFVQGPSVGNSFDTSSALYRYTARLGQLRSALSPLRRGSFQAIAYRNNAPGELVFLRRHAGNAVLVAMNTALTGRNLTSFIVTEYANKTLVNALNPTMRIEVGADGRLPARTLEGQAAEIWIPSEFLPPLQPEVLSFLPADGAVNVPLLDPLIEVRFLTPMDEVTTTEAISISPEINFQVEWDVGRQVARLAPSGTLEPRTSYVVRVAETAESDEGVRLAASSSATWITDRAPLELPPPPEVLGTVPPLTVPIDIDGGLFDWPPFEPPPRNSPVFPDGGGFVWLDALNDDDGPGTYTYPSNAVFTGGDADLDEFRFGYSNTDFYFAIKPASINPTASFFTPYFGIGINLGGTGRPGSLGVHLGTDERGIAELQVREDLAPEFELCFNGPVGARLVTMAGQSITVQSAFSQQTGIVELRVPRALLGMEATMIRQPLALVVYTGLETFGGMREVVATRSEWNPGGGITATSDPDVFDLAGATQALQRADLAGFDDLSPSTIVYSVLRVELTEASEGDFGTTWMIR